REQFTCSMAVNAMLGAALGVGDRHLDNILLDPQTGRTCHIDFGVVFDHGRHLRVPETVPFRLTRTLAHAMVPGTFEHHGSLTAAVLRLYAPLYRSQLMPFHWSPLALW
ncbi:hypothetical protein CXG81DRAFT_2953, partial [Caulochytrium protostelioides]